MDLTINNINFDENETIDKYVIHFGPKVICEDNVDSVKKENTLICCNCKKKVRFKVRSKINWDN